jgi:hypothetical protein
MSANHTLVRVGDHKITGHKNDSEIWKIDQAGWRGSNPVATVTATMATNPVMSFPVHIYQVGHMIYLEFPAYGQSGPAVGTVALITNACIPAAYRPANRVYFPYRFVKGLYVFAGILMVDPAGTLNFGILQDAQFVQASTDNGFTTGWDETVGAFYSLHEEAVTLPPP